MDNEENDQLLLNRTAAAVEQEKQRQNAYSSTKSIGQAFLNTAIITWYIKTLVSLFTIENLLPLGGFEISLIVLTCSAIALQVLIFALITILYKTNGDYVARNCKTTSVNVIVTILTAVSLICNIAITAVAGQIKGLST